MENLGFIFADQRLPYMFCLGDTSPNFTHHSPLCNVSCAAIATYDQLQTGSHSLVMDKTIF